MIEVAAGTPKTGVAPRAVLGGHPDDEPADRVRTRGRRPSPRRPRRRTETLGEKATDGASLAEALGGHERRDPASVQRRISPSDGVDRVLGQYEMALKFGYDSRNSTGSMTANVSGHGPWLPTRDRTIMLVKQLGRRRWKKALGYHHQGRMENAFFRYKSIIGDGFLVLSPAGQESEAVLGCQILNRMTALGRLASYRIGR